MVCPKDYGILTSMIDGKVICVHHNELNSMNITSKYQDYYLRDEDNMLLNDALIHHSLVDQVLNTMNSLVPNNSVESFMTPSIISVIVIGFALGAAIVALQRRTRTTPASDTVLLFCSEMSEVSNVVIGWIISLAPYCIGFLIAASLASAGNVVNLLQTVGIYVVSVVCGLALHLLVVLPLLFLWYTGGENPYKWLYTIRQPILVAFSTESSAASLPVSIRTAIDSGLVAESTANTILPMGSTINMDGTAIGFPCAINFLAHSAGLQSNFDISTWVNVGLGASLGSAGTAPVPNAAIVMLITVWETAVPHESVPDAIAYVQAIAFLVSRFQTAVNVASDLFIVRMIQCGIDAEKVNM
eukprot:CAMPEP_0185017614 /NCGR_PEP_ID=MMETSP1103-20130426/547_1 /TAXON_ID=36769 /ORGANISM="Paraphysomonas bandaiensis, Strain Caron Lab Isolate" /LENGTH=356 /DNA_ID=CAMNT_0027547109 /DNA_START=469 /DNA_END=1539 /DNA_ORIENTATION=+